MSAHVLIVDDSKIDRFFIRRLLDYLGVESDEASSGRECVRSVKNNEYSIILMDYLMPIQNGVETLLQIRDGTDNKNASTPVVALVSPDDPGEGRVCLESGFNNFLEKPVDFKQLIATLIMYLPDAIRRELKLPAAKSVHKEDIYKNVQARQDSPVNSPQVNTSENESLAKVRTVSDIDVDKGISLCGSEDGYLTALDIFYHSIAGKADEIEMYYRNKDYTNYTIKVHALKSSGNLIGIEKIRADAKELEDAGNEGDFTKIEAKTEGLLEFYRSFLDKLSFLDKTADENKPPVDEAQLQDAYNALKEFCESMDFDLASMVVESMKEYKLPESDSEKFRLIEEKLSELDWDAIQELVK